MVVGPGYVSSPSPPSRHGSRSLLLLTSCHRDSLGGATTQGVLSFWLLAMVLYPETQNAAWEELDAVVGRQQPPRWEHCEKMPYLLATVRETLRWRPTLPCGLMHVASEVGLTIAALRRG